MLFSDILLQIKRSQKMPPINVTRLIQSFGVELRGAIFKDKHVSGKIIYSENLGKYLIYVNTQHHVTRQRFTAAHELSHYLLHKKEIGDGITENALYRNDKLSNKLEIEANKMAADILMPFHLINPLIKLVKNHQELANIFKVSLPAMRIRLGLSPH